jgi:O-antigen/teichoic acid export membrane protein
MDISPVQRQSLITVIWQITFTAIGFLSTMYFAHAVGASIMGAYFLFVAYNGVFGTVADGGFGNAAVKRISEGEEPNEYFSAYSVIRLLFTAIVLLFLIMFKPYFVDLNNSGMFTWLLIVFAVSLIVGIISSGTAGTGKMGVRTSCAGVGNISKLVVQVIAIYLGYEAAGLAAGAVVGLIIAALIEIRFLDLHFKRFTIEHIKKLSTFSFWIFLTSGGMLVFTQADTILIGYFMSNSDVGIYRIVFQFTSIATLTTYALRNTLWPRISRWGKLENTCLIEASLSRAISYSLVLAIPVFTGGILLGDKLLFFFYGEEFIAGYAALVVLLAVQIVNVFQYFFTMYLDALDRPKQSFKVTVVGVIANIILNILLIPLIGIFGAAVATLVTMVLNAFLARNELSSLMTIRLEKHTILAILQASIFMGAFVAGYRLLISFENIIDVLIPVIIGVAIYGIMLLKVDNTIHKEIMSIILKIGLPWPRWL